ncbi:MAG: SCP2 sterol-binding domain-containing protein [Burkholderiaceae bacterium]
MPVSSFSRPPLPFLPGLLGAPLDALPAAINHLLAAEPWARAQLMPHVGKTLHVVVQPFTIKLSVTPDGSVARAAGSVVADTTLTLPYSALPRMLAGGADAVMRDLHLEGDAEFAQAVSMLAKNLRWDVEEDLSKVVGDVASHRIVATAQKAGDGIKRTNERALNGITEYLLEENPQLVRPRAVQVLADGVRQLRDDLARLEKRLDRVALASAARA